jgi:hypothetical protein
MMNYLTNKIETHLNLTFVILLIFHLCLSCIFFLIANSEYFSNLHNGQGVWHFAADTSLYHNEALHSKILLQNSDWLGWYNSFLGHKQVKFIGLFYWLSGFDLPIIFEIINGPIWACSVLLLFRSTREIFKENTVIPIIVVLFFFQPSVLLHSSQLLRDPFVLFGVCMLCYGWTLIHKPSHAYKGIFYIVFGSFFFLSMKSYLSFVLFLIFTSYLVYTFFSKDISWKVIFFLSIPLTFVCIIDTSSNKGDVSFLSQSIEKGVINKPESDSQNNINQELISIEKVIDRNKSFLISSRNKELTISSEVIKPIEISEEGVITNRAKLLVVDDELASTLKDLKKFTAFENKNKPRPQQLSELEIMQRYYSYLNFLIENKDQLSYEGNLISQPEYEKFLSTLELSHFLVESRINEIYENELKWQSQNMIFKSLDLVSWRLLEFRTSFQDTHIFGSTIDPVINLSNFKEAILYFPRAVQISFLTPFPYHWFEEGYRTGKIGRIISGLETLVLYFILLGFCYASIKHFSRIKPLIPVTILSGGVIILTGYSIPNFGQIYRFRLDLIAPFFIIGSYGITILAHKLNKNNNNL